MSRSVANASLPTPSLTQETHQLVAPVIDGAAIVTLSPICSPLVGDGCAAVLMVGADGRLDATIPVGWL